MDALLQQSFLEALKTRLKDKDLPILLNVFFSTHLLAAKPQDASLDVKKSSYKKLSKFVEEMAKQGLVTTSEPSPGVIHIATVNRSHPLYRSHKRVTPKEEKEESASSPLIVELYRPTKSLFLLFPDAPEDKYYVRKEAQEALWRYVKEKDLTEKSSGEVKLDEMLAAALFPKSRQAGDLLSKKELVDKFIDKLAKFYRVNRGVFSEIRKGAVQCAQIVVEQRQARKFVTKVSGLETFAISPEEVAHNLQKKFAAATTINQLPAKGAGVEVQVQGNFLSDLEEYLIAQYSIPRKYVEATDKTHKKKK
jgi:translation initiation factor 2D